MISFREVLFEDAELILNWRTSPNVTRFMTTDVCLDLQKQQNWILKCQDKQDYYHWIIQVDDVDVGLIYITDFVREKKVVNWGYYVAREDFSGIGAFVPPYFYNFAFLFLGVDTIVADVFYNNTNVIGMHLIYGYKFAPHMDRVIVKNGREILLIGMVLNKMNWKFNRFMKSKAIFPIRNGHALKESNDS